LSSTRKTPEQPDSANRLPEEAVAEAAEAGAAEAEAVAEAAEVAEAAAVAVAAAACRGDLAAFARLELSDHVVRPKASWPGLTRSNPAIDVLFVALSTWMRAEDLRMAAGRVADPIEERQLRERGRAVGGALATKEYALPWRC
jgi:hypothetical protein